MVRSNTTSSNWETYGGIFYDVFAYGQTYALLLSATSVQGIGCACTRIAGMAMLLEAYPDDAERGSAVAIAGAGSGLGSVLGPSFGGLLYQMSGKETPFLILALLALGDGVLRLLALKPQFEEKTSTEGSWMNVLLDPYIMIIIGAMFCPMLSMAAMESSLSLWMMQEMNANPVTVGLVYVALASMFLIGINISGHFGHLIGRWLAVIIGLLGLGFCLILVPLSTNAYLVAVYLGAYGFFTGLLDGSLYPEMAHLADIRHNGVYGNLYGIGFSAGCLAFALGAYSSGLIVSNLDFPSSTSTGSPQSPSGSVEGDHKWKASITSSEVPGYDKLLIECRQTPSPEAFDGGMPRKSSAEKVANVYKRTSRSLTDPPSWTMSVLSSDEIEDYRVLAINSTDTVPRTTTEVVELKEY